jgi:hypothetical protein
VLLKGASNKIICSKIIGRILAVYHSVEREENLTVLKYYPENIPECPSFSWGTQN